MINNLTFSGGTHVRENKEFSNKCPLEEQEVPNVVHIPLLQGIGSECTPLVKKGDVVKVGQKIGDVNGGFGASVHASISGTVIDISEMFTTEGKKVKCISIERDDSDQNYEEGKDVDSEKKLKAEEIADIARESGIVGMGGAGFPFGSKLSGAVNNDIDSVIANGAECEPFLTSDHSLMLNYYEEILKGVSLVIDALNAKAGYIAIEDNKPDAIEKFESVISEYENITVASLITKYPQGDSTRIVDSVLNRKVPIGGRTGSVNAFVSNVGTFKALYDAVYKNVPLYRRVVSVTGAGVQNPRNLVVRVGTTVMDLIEQCGGFKDDVAAVIAGGPMSGHQIYDLNSPITKTITGIVVLTQKDVDLRKETPCIKCGRCVKVCPSKLSPAKIDAAVRKNLFEMAKNLHAEECIQCGTCSYVCPAKRDLAESVKLALNEIKTRIN